MGITLAALADMLGAELRGDPGREVTSVGSLEHAGDDAVSFYSNARYRQKLRATRAAAVILQARHAGESPAAVLVVSNPCAAFARVAGLLGPRPSRRQGIDPSAVIAGNCQIAASAWIGPRCVLEEGAVIGAGTQLAAGCFVGRGSRVGRDGILHPNVVICHGVSIGDRAILHPGAVVGSDGFGLARDGEQWLKVPQLGGVLIGDDVEIGANTTIDRGALDNTVIGNGVKLDNQIQVAHNVHIGDHTVMAGCVGISGSARIGKRCMIGGGVGVVGHLDIADDVTVTGMTMVTQSITRPGVYSSGLPAQENTAWCRNTVRLRQLDGFARRLQLLEKKLIDS
jgi:UDP-3-O-[3-hydroxymyristoyl] glucosamine N-acyltransferase